MKLKTTCAAVALSLGLGVAADAANIMLTDPSFETALSGTNGVTVSGWWTFGPSAEASAGLALDGTGFFNAMTPLDGTAGGYVVSTGENDGASVYQTVEFDAGVTYNFTVALGTNDLIPKSDGKFGVVIFDSNFANNVAGTFGTLAAGGGTFSDYSVEYTPTVSGKYQVGIRSLGYVPGTGADNNESAVFYDNARLTVVPEPSAAAFLGLGGLGLILRRRK